MREICLAVGEGEYPRLRDTWIRNWLKGLAGFSLEVAKLSCLVDKGAVCVRSREHGVGDSGFCSGA